MLVSVLWIYVLKLCHMSYEEHSHWVTVNEQIVD